jgi:hypothetical protein
MHALCVLTTVPLLVILCIISWTIPIQSYMSLSLSIIDTIPILLMCVPQPFRHPCHQIELVSTGFSILLAVDSERYTHWAQTMRTHSFIDIFTGLIYCSPVAHTTVAGNAVLCWVALIVSSLCVKVLYEGPFMSPPKNVTNVISYFGHR